MNEWIYTQAWNFVLINVIARNDAVFILRDMDSTIKPDSYLILNFAKVIK